MTAAEPTILATSAGFRLGEATTIYELSPVVDLALELADVSGRRPRLLHLGTAFGDQHWQNALLSEAGVAAGIELRHLVLFPRPNVADIAAYVLDHDLVWVSGGSVANLLVLWRLHGVDIALRAAWEAGIVLAGVSAGSICWHVGGSTDSFGIPLHPVTNGLGFLPYSNGVHHDANEHRRPALHGYITDGLLPDGYATEDGTGLVYRGTDLVEAVTEVPGKHAYFVHLVGDTVVEDPIEPRLLR